MRPKRKICDKVTADKVPVKKSTSRKAKLTKTDECQHKRRPGLREPGTKPSVSTTKPSNVKESKAKTGSSNLSAYFKSYKGGLGDYHIPIFKELKRVTCPDFVLYPGCHRHITASIIFSNVLYVDNYSKIKPFFDDDKVLEFVNKNKDYEKESVIRFKCRNFESDFGEKEQSFDLLMSLSAGIVSQSCAKYLKPGGYFFANDGHYDARMAFTDPRFKFVAVYDDTTAKFDMSEDAKVGHFFTKKGDAMTKEMVQESIDVPKARRSFKLQKETLYYLFQKI
eukprot:gene12130-13383_t